MPATIGYAATARTRETISPEMSRHRFGGAVKRLATSVAASWKEGENRRLWRQKYLSAYMGDHCDGAPGDQLKRPVNVFHRAMNLIAGTIASTDPTVEIGPRASNIFRGAANARAFLHTNLLRELKYRHTERLVILDALMDIGIAQVGVAASELATDGQTDVGVAMDPGRPFICRRSPADFIFDAAARTVLDQNYSGHRYRCTTDGLRMLGLDDDEITALPKWIERPGRTDGETERMGMGDDRRMDLAEFVELSDLIDLWIAPGVLSREPLILTLPGDPNNIDQRISEMGSRAFVREPREWAGPQLGPYSYLIFNETPDNHRGTPDAGFFKILADMIAALSAAKIDGDLRARKIVLAGESFDQSDVQALENSRSNSVLRVKDPRDAQSVEMGGAGVQVIESLRTFMSLFDTETSANLLSGANAGTGKSTTAAEVQALQGHLAARINTREQAFYEHADDVVTRLDFYVGNDPLLDTEVVFERMGFKFPVRVTPEMFRDNDGAEWAFQVRRGSFRRLTDEAKGKAVMQFAVGVVPVGIDVAIKAAQAGIRFNLTEFYKMASAGALDSADIEALVDDGGVTAMQNMMLAAQPAAQGGETPLRRPGLPGTASIKGNMNTGSASPNFDAAAGTQATNAVMGGAQGGY